MGDRDVVDIDDAGALADCIAPLDAEQRSALRGYWEQVIREEWVPPTERVPARPAMAGLDERRARREARRAMARIAQAGRVDRGTVLAFPSADERLPLSGGEAA
jgi:hypothetical protein